MNGFKVYRKQNEKTENMDIERNSNMIIRILLLTTIFLIAGCGPHYYTLEEKLARPSTKHMPIKIKPWPEYMQASVGIQNALQVRNRHQAYIEIEPNPHSTQGGWDELAVNTYIALEIDPTLGGLSILHGAMKSLGPEASLARRYDSTSRFISMPSVHYYRFNDGDQQGTEQDLINLEENTLRLFNLTYNFDGNCKLRIHPKLGYLKAHIHQVPGFMRDSTYFCDNPAYADTGLDTLVYVNVWNTPNIDGLVTLAAIEANCSYFILEGKTRRISDQCGQPLADEHAKILDDYLIKNDWMRVVIRPTKSDAGTMEIISTYRGNSYVSPARPFFSDGYINWLRYQDHLNIKSAPTDP